MLNRLSIIVVELLICLLIVLYLRYFIPYVRTKISNAKLELIRQWANIFVYAAEQILIGSGRGEEKLDVVSNQLYEKSNKIGFRLTKTDIRTIIEDCVKQMNTLNSKE